MSGTTLIIGATHVVRLTNVLDTVTGESMNNADVTVTVYDAREQPVAGVEWPLAAQNDADGSYVAVLPEALELKDGKTYTLEVVVDGGEGKRRPWRELVVARLRT